MNSFKQFDFTHNGKLYRAELHRDDDMEAPWEEHDGHGVYVGKKYDKAATLARATADGWGIGDDEKIALAVKLKREPSEQDITEEAMRLDHERMTGWISGEWFWCGVVVYALDAEYERTGETQSLWGIESDSFDYIKNTVAPDLASQL